MARIRILTGHRRYADPWHPFAETSEAVRSVLSGAGYDVSVVVDEPSSLHIAADVDLVVANVGGQPQRVIEPDPVWAEAHAAFGGWIRDGGLLLGLHTASNAFPDWAEWPALLGGRWVRGVSGHPERSIATFEPVPGAESHPVWAGLDAVTAYDERYSDMAVFSGSQPVIQHETGETLQVAGWVKGDTVIYDSLGHNGRSYASESRVRFLLNEVAWLLR